MRAVAVEVESGGGDSLAQHSLSEREPGQRHGVEAAERMERIALVVRAAYRGVQEREVERGVVADENRALAAVGTNRLAHRREHEVERGALGHGAAQRAVGVDAGN